jgi:hypothetical protein
MMAAEQGRQPLPLGGLWFEHKGPVLQSLAKDYKLLGLALEALVRLSVLFFLDLPSMPPVLLHL